MVTSHSSPQKSTYILILYINSLVLLKTVSVKEIKEKSNMYYSYYNIPLKSVTSLSKVPEINI